MVLKGRWHYCQELTKINKENSGEAKKKKKKEMPVLMSYPLLRILYSRIHLGWEMCAPPGRTLSQTKYGPRWLSRDNLETNLIIITPETMSHTWQSSSPGFPYPATLCLSTPSNKASCFVSMRVSPWTIYFSVLEKSTLLGPGRGPTSCKTFMNSLWKSSV